MEEFGESEMSESLEEEMSRESSEESMQDIDKNAQIYTKLQGQDDIDEDAEIEEALNTIKSQETKPDSKKVDVSEAKKAEAVVTQKKVLDTYLHQRILLQKCLQLGNKMP